MSNKKNIYKLTGYTGKDKKTCESILSSENNKYCILDMIMALIVVTI